MAAEHLEQYMLELVNSERAKADLPPLALNSLLSKAAEAHNNWMVKANKFQHEGQGGSSPTQRMRSAGYIFTGIWESGENLAWTSPKRSIAGFQDEMMVLHNNLMNSTVHRHNILGKSFKEVGLNFQIADRYQGVNGAVLVAQEFALSGPAAFLLGTVFVDKDNDGFYDPGEGVEGVEIEAFTSHGESYKTRTNAMGAYKLVLPPDNYSVSFHGHGVDATKSIVMANRNLKIDLISSQVTAQFAASRKPLQAESARVFLSLGFNDKLTMPK